jgi:hypothetical protein
MTPTGSLNAKSVEQSCCVSLVARGQPSRFEPLTVNVCHIMGGLTSLITRLILKVNLLGQAFGFAVMPTVLQSVTFALTRLITILTVNVLLYIKPLIYQ